MKELSEKESEEYYKNIMGSLAQERFKLSTYIAEIAEDWADAYISGFKFITINFKYTSNYKNEFSKLKKYIDEMSHNPVPVFSYAIEDDICLVLYFEGYD